ncbi:hypothetical protein AhyVDH1_047 [Aeromonas phage AhyVDH1]|nr:hypothetical protein AhyVDH1_047 [Aeromonas phage AhyVDH1]
MTKQTQAQAKAASLCLDILTASQLIGDDLVSKLPAARDAILEALPKAYAAINAVAVDTGEDVSKVRNAISSMYGRSKWADHDAMMDMVQGALESMVADAQKVVAVAPVEPSTAMGDATYREMEQGLKEEIEAIEPVAEAVANYNPAIVAMAKDSKQGLEVRITKLGNALNTLSEADLEQFLIVSPLVAVAYGLIDGRYSSHTDLTIAPGFQTEQEALEVCGPNHVVKTRREALTEALMSSKEAYSKLREYLSKEPVAVAPVLKVSHEWERQQLREQALKEQQGAAEAGE